MDKKLNVLVDIGHPAHVHFFKNFIWELQKQGHNVIVTEYDKDNCQALLDLYNIQYLTTVRYGREMVSKAYQNIKLAWKLKKIIKAYNIDYAVGIGSYPEAWATLGTNCRCFVFSDTEHARVINNLAKFACTNLISPSCYLIDEGPKQIRYAGYHELAYLHPNRFTPAPSIYSELNLSKQDRYVIIRFVAWEASHDIGQKGFSRKDKIALIHEIEKNAIPLITSEGPVPDELNKYKIKIPLHKIHDALAYASLYIGEGATMASECAMLGTPNIFVHEMAGVLGTTKDQEKYGLMINQREFNLKRTIQLMKESFDNIDIWHRNKLKMLNEKIDVTQFMVNFILNYSRKINK